MPLDFYLLGATFFRARVRPALTASWRRRSFVPCRDVCAEILAKCRPPPPEDTVLRRVPLGLPFSREIWNALAGEILIFGCDDMPLVQTAPATLCCLLAPAQYRAGDCPRTDRSR